MVVCGNVARLSRSLLQLEQGWDAWNSSIVNGVRLKKNDVE
jgi:hypothetical protein